MMPANKPNGPIRSGAERVEENPLFGDNQQAPAYVSQSLTVLQSAYR
ncbi:unnamed protein product [Ectocarpus sp. CCAP 1310/34]|nr:unnamed protein product [Ectocarpus sp. CCAP 1310/34]